MVAWGLGVGRKFLRSLRKLLGGAGYAQYLDCGDGFMGINICQNLSNCCFKYVWFMHQLDLNRAVRYKKEEIASEVHTIKKGRDRVDMVLTPNSKTIKPR